MRWLVGEDLFDRIEVWAIGRQEDEMGAGGADRFAGRMALVAAEVVEDDLVDYCARCPERDLNQFPANGIPIGGRNDIRPGTKPS
jgi:hypothetical protein